MLTTAPLSPGTATSGLGFFLSYTEPYMPHQTVAISRIALADFNGDGRLDAAVTEGGYGEATMPVSILLGNGDGTMTPLAPVPVSAPEGGQSIAIADFNGDGVPDMVVNLYNPETVPPGAALNQLQVYLGQGDGTFTLGQVISAPDPTSIVTGDFNGDGISDLALSIFVSPTAPGYILIALGNGDGTFTISPNTAPTKALGVNIAVGDFNRDGKADIAVVGEASLGDGEVTILLGNGDGTFTPSLPSFPTDEGPQSIVAADVNGDGILDLAVGADEVTISGVSSIDIFLGNGDGTFTSAPTVTTYMGAVSGQHFTVGDFNGDNIADFAFSSGVAGGGVRFGVALGNSDGTFAPLQLLRPCSSQYCGNLDTLAAGDFNGDGLSDLASDTSNGSNIVTNMSVDLAAQSIDTAAASSPIVTLAPGSGVHLVYASYPGDGTFPPSISGTIALVAPAAASSLTLSATPQTVYLGQQVALSATIAPSVLFGNTPSGRVVFSSGGNPFGKATSSGTATFVLDTTTLPVGANSVSAAYTGDGNFNASNSTPVVVNVLPPDFAIAVSPSLLSIVQGGSGSAAVTITALGSFTQTVQLSCSGLPINSTCAFSPATVTVGATPVSSTMTVVTTSQHASLSGTHRPAEFALAFPFDLAGLFALRKGRRRGYGVILRVLLLCAGLGAALAMLGCGEKVFLIASPIGTSAFTITGSTINSTSISHSANVTLTVMQ